jgi:hypothetical protein
MADTDGDAQMRIHCTRVWRVGEKGFAEMGF